MCWDSEITRAIAVGTGYVLVFLLAELWRKYGQPEVEKTRKLVHIAGGFIALSFCYLFNSQWTVLVLCSGFALLLFLTRKMGVLKSVHDIDRESSGGFYYPVAIYLTFLFANAYNLPHFYFISVLVLGISDSLAALIGASYGFKLYRVEEEAKSLEGSVIFFMSTFLIVLICLLLLTDIGKLECILSSLYISMLVTAFEAISLGGADNIFVPIGTLFILSRITTKPPEEMGFQICLLILVFLVVWLIAYSTRRIGSSGAVGLALISYGACALVGYEWVVPILISTLLISYTDLFIAQPQEKQDIYRIRSVFYVVLVPLAWILAANVYPENKSVYLVPYLITFITGLTMIWVGRSREVKRNNEQVVHNDLYHMKIRFKVLVLCLIFLPVHFLLDLKPEDILIFFIVYFLSSFASRVFWELEDSIGKDWSFLNLLRLRTVVIFFISLVAYELYVLILSLLIV